MFHLAWLGALFWKVKPTDAPSCDGTAMDDLYMIKNNIGLLLDY